MRKIVVGALSLGIIFAGGIAVAADEDNTVSKGKGTLNFGQMSQRMEEIHPDWSKEYIQNMYNAMHGTTGAAPSSNFEEMNYPNNAIDFNQMSGIMNNLSPEGFDKMVEFMQNYDGPVNYGQMLDIMEEVHPDFSKEQMNEMYNAMHGTNGAAPSANFRGMSGGMNHPMFSNE
ncbi:hypothetical protein RZN25_13035 [Bacillaceae bacterium S4-13-56]